MKIITDMLVDHFVIDRSSDFSSIKFVNCQIKSVRIIDRTFGSLWFKDSVVFEGIEIINSDVDIVQTDYAKLYKKILIQDSKIFMIDFSVHLDTSFSGKCTVKNSDVEEISLNSYGSVFEIINSKLGLSVSEYAAKNFSYHQENSDVDFSLKNHSEDLIPEFKFIDVGDIEFVYSGKSLPKILFQDCGSVRLHLGEELYNEIDFINNQKTVLFTNQGSKVKVIKVFNTEHFGLNLGPSSIDKIDIKDAKKSNITLRENAFINSLEFDHLDAKMFILEESKINHLKCKSLYVSKFFHLRNSEIKTMRVYEKLSKQQDSEMTQNNVENFKVELLQVRGMFYENLDHLVFDRG